MAEIKKTETVKAVTAVKTPVVSAAEKVEAKKPEVKKPAVKKATAAPAKKPAVKKAVVKAEDKKPAEKKAAKPAAKKAAKPATKKAAPKKAAATKEAKAEIKTNIVLQYADKNVTFDTLVENAQNVCLYDMGKKAADIEKLDLYVKPEENTVYFVLNDKEHSQYGL